MYQRSQCSFLYYLFYVIFILYCFMTSTSMTSCFLKGDINDGIGWAHPSFSIFGGRDLSFLALVHIKLAYIIILSFAYMQFFGGHHLKLCKRYKVRKLTLGNIVFGRSTSRCRQLISRILVLFNDG